MSSTREKTSHDESKYSTQRIQFTLSTILYSPTSSGPSVSVTHPNSSTIRFYFVFLFDLHTFIHSFFFFFLFFYFLFFLVLSLLLFLLYQVVSSVFLSFHSSLFPTGRGLLFFGPPFPDLLFLVVGEGVGSGWGAGVRGVIGAGTGGSVAKHAFKNPVTSKPGGTRTLSMA